MNYMRKWDTLYLSCTAYAPRYFDPALVDVHEHVARTAAGCSGAATSPWFPMDRSLGEAQALPLDDEAMALFLGGTARRLLDRT